MDLYVYAGIGLFGFLLILASFVLGEVGHLGDLGHLDINHDIHVEGFHGEHGGMDGDDDAPGPLSLRVVAIFLTAFGTIAAGARLSGLHSLTSAALGFAGGYALGWMIWKFMCFLYTQGGSSEILASQLEGCSAEVTVAIPPGGPGQVACVVNGTRTYQIARAENGFAIPLGSSVHVLRATAEGVIVEPLPEEDGNHIAAQNKENAK